MRRATIPALLLLIATASCERGQAPVTPANPEAAAPLSGAVKVELTLPLSAAPQVPQAVKDLGLSARRDGSTWTIRGRMLHAALTDEGDLMVEMVEGPDGVQVLFRAAWTRALDPPQAFAEIQERMTGLARKVALFQSETKPKVRCIVVIAGAETPCSGAI